LDAGTAGQPRDPLSGRHLPQSRHVLLRVAPALRQATLPVRDVCATGPRVRRTVPQALQAGRGACPPPVGGRDLLAPEARGASALWLAMMQTRLAGASAGTTDGKGIFGEEQDIGLDYVQGGVVLGCDRKICA
jgi:hypothetical protein